MKDIEFPWQGPTHGELSLTAVVQVRLDMWFAVELTARASAVSMRTVARD